MPALLACLLALAAEPWDDLAVGVPALTPEMTLEDLLAAPFGVLATELSPAVVIRCAGPEVRLFGGLREHGAPTRIHLPAAGGVREVAPGGEWPAMSEAWLLASFAGAEGWTVDVPVLLVLQHRPAAAELTSDGLTLRFAGEAGLIAVMPLDGARPRAPGELGAADFARCRRWARWLRRVPIHADERWSLEGDDAVLRSHVTWLPIDDDWATPAERLLPLPPVLGLAWWAGQHGAEKPFPMRLDVRVTDPELATPYGPYLGAEGTDALEVRLAVLPYLRASLTPPEAFTGPLAELHERLIADLAAKFRTDSWEQIWDHGGPENYCWQAMGDRYYAQALPLLPPELRQRVGRALVGYLDQWVLREERYAPFRGMLLLKGPGIGTWGGYDDAGKFSSNLLVTIAEIAEATGCWDLIRERWDTIRRFDITPLECDWKAFGRYSIAELGDEASPPRAMARLAWRVGDREQFALSAVVFARELVHHYVKQVGAEYFRALPPPDPAEPMPEEVYLTNLWGDVAGWRIDGPTWPREHGERQYTNRWVRFGDSAVGRFYQDVLPGSIAAELDRLEQRADIEANKFKPDVDTAHIAPSLPRLRALLQGTPGEALLERYPRDGWRVGRHSDRTAMAVPLLRNGAGRRWREDLPAVVSHEVLGLERLRATAESTSLAWALEAPANGPPHLRWFDQLRPERWSFGQVSPAGSLSGPRSSYLNWNTRAVVYDAAP